MIYSFRAECLHDVDELLKVIRGTLVREYRRDPGYPDVEIEFDSPADLAILKAIMSIVEDGHVMRETLRTCPLSENNLEREYGV